MLRVVPIFALQYNGDCDGLHMQRNFGLTGVPHAGRGQKGRFFSAIHSQGPNSVRAPEETAIAARLKRLKSCLSYACGQ